MKHEKVFNEIQGQKRMDTTMCQILLISATCFVLGIAIFQQVGMHAHVDISNQQSQLLKEQNTLQREIKQLEDAMTSTPSSFVEVRMSVNKKQTKHKTQSTIEKPLVDKKEYKYLKLENKLKVLIVRDPESRMSSAALNVNAGSWQEPNEFPGLAHFLEHMLFQGSETYPETSYFEKRVASGGGSTNAYTQGGKTNYYFEIENSKYLDTLDVFAHFFIDPLLSKDMVNKEANAVNSEYEINVNGDGWKLMHLITLMADPKHPFSRFSIGNLDSLVKPDIVEALRKFHDEYYSANQMALVVRSNMDISKVEEYIRNSEFNKIPNKDLPKPSLAKFGMPIPKMGQLLKYHINQRQTTVFFIYQLHDSMEHYQSKPMDFINSIIRSRHEGGLYNYLLDKKYIVDLDAGTFLEGSGTYMFYLIAVELNESMIDNKADITLDIGQAIISYFESMIREYYDEEMNAKPLLKETFESKQALADVQFKYLEKEADIFKLSNNLNTFPFKKVLSADSLYFKYDDQVIYNYLADLYNPQNMMVFIGDDGYHLDEKLVVADEVDAASFLSYFEPSTLLFTQMAEVAQDDMQFITTADVTQQNQLYHLQYDMKQLNQATVDFIGMDGQDLKMPPINKYIPKDLTFKSLCQVKAVEYIQTVDSNTMYDRQHRMNLFLEENHKMPFLFTSEKECKKHEFEYETYNNFPQLIQKNLEGKTWWRLDRSYSPTVYGGLTLETALEMKSLKRQSLVRVFNAYITDHLRETMQPSFEAGYGLTFDSSIRGLSLEMYGWSDKFDVFYRNILQEIRSTTDNADRLERVKASLIMEQQNIYEQKLFMQAISNYIPWILQGTPTPQEMIEETQAINQSELQEFQKELLGNFRFTSYFTGNILRDDVTSLTKMIHEIFDETTQEVRFANHQTSVADLTGKSIQYAFISKSTNADDLNGATVNYYQIGHRDQKSFALMNMLQSQLHNAAYAYLRTQLQLGYVVSVRFRPVGCMDSAQILVQGTAKPPHEVNKHIEAFLIKYDTQLKQMTDAQFDDLKTTTTAMMRDNIKSLKDKARQTWGHIKNNDLAFEEKEVAASIIEQMTKQDLFEFFDRVFNSGKLSLQIYGQGMVSQSMNAKNTFEWSKIVEANELQADATYSLRKEQLVLSMDEFKQNIRRNYNCNYKISNV